MTVSKWGSYYVEVYGVKVENDIRFYGEEEQPFYEKMKRY